MARQITCKKCKTQFNLPIPGWNTPVLPYWLKYGIKCPNCGVIWSSATEKVGVVIMGIIIVWIILYALFFRKLA